MNTYELGVFCDGINTLRLCILINPVDRNRTRWEANLLGYINDEIIENVGNLFLVRGHSKTGVFHGIVEELKKANSKTLLRDGVKSILEDLIPKEEKPKPVHRHTGSFIAANVYLDKEAKSWTSKFTKPTRLLREICLALFEAGYQPIVHVPYDGTEAEYVRDNRRARAILNDIRAQYSTFTFTITRERK